MKHWQETALILDEAAKHAAAGHRTALATVVRIEGSAYRRPGARLLIAGDGAMSGGVSGGCLEADVREVALGVMRSGQPALRMYDTSGDEQQVWGLGMGCNGMVEVFIEPLDVSSPRMQQLREQLKGDAPISLDIVIAEQPRRVFTETLEPPPRLIICGAGDDARPLAALGHQAGFRVTVVDHRAGYLAAERFPGVRTAEARPEAGLDSLGIGPDSCVVIMTHSEAHDRGWLRAALDSPAGYIGLLGPRRRGEKLLGMAGGDATGRVFTPIGLDLGSDGPEQIAVSIVAELLAHRSGREGSHLRNRQAGIHGG